MNKIIKIKRKLKLNILMDKIVRIIINKIIIIIMM